jgi:phage host-nuclease inhibitor protein Gam
MTLVVYDADRLDATALRVLDIAATIRQIGAILRENPDVDLAIHDKKAAEWLSYLETWAADCSTKLNLALVKQRGAKRAKNYPAK